MLKNGLIEGKVHMKDIKEGTHPRDMPCLIVGDKKFWSMATSKDQLATHDDCERCGVEFEKNYSNSRHCIACSYTIRMDNYLSMPFKEWDGIEPVFSSTLDQYFFGSDEIEDYLNDNEVEPGTNLMLVICNPNYAYPIEADHFEDILPEDGDLPSGLEEAMNEFNKKLSALPPVSWSAGKIRTSYVSIQED